MGSIFAIFVIDKAQSDSFLSARSCCHSDFPFSVPDVGHAGLAPSLHGLACSGSHVFVCGVSSLSLSLLVLDAAAIGFTTSLHSFGWSDSMPPVLGFQHVDLPLPLQSYLCSDSVVSICGMSRPGFVFLLSVIATANLESSLLLQSLARMDLSLLALDFAYLDLPVPVQSLGRFGPAALAFDLLHLGSSLPLHSSSRQGLASPTIGTTYLESCLSAFNTAALGSPFPARSRVCLGLSLLVLDHGSVGFPILFRSYARFGLSLFIYGLLAIGSLYSLSILDATKVDFSVPIRSPSCLGPLVSAPGLAHLGSSSSVQQLACSGLMVLTFGLSWVGFVSFLSVAETVKSEFFPLLQSFSRVDSAMLASNSASIGSTSPLQDSACLGPSAPVFGKSSLELMPLVSGFTSTDPLFFLQSFGCLGSPLLVLGFATTDLPFSARNLA